MYKSVLKHYSKRDLIVIRGGIKSARDKTQKVIDKLEKNRPPKLKQFKRKSGIVDLEKQLRFLNKSLNKIEEAISTK